MDRLKSDRLGYTADGIIDGSDGQKAPAWKLETFGPFKRKCGETAKNRYITIRFLREGISSLKLFGGWRLKGERASSMYFR